MDSTSPGSLTADDLTAIRRQLADGQNMVRETVDRLRQSQEENEMILRRKDELESRVAALETEYEELLGKSQTCDNFVVSDPFQKRQFTTKRLVTWIWPSR